MWRPFVPRHQPVFHLRCNNRPVNYADDLAPLQQHRISLAPTSQPAFSTVIALRIFTMLHRFSGLVACSLRPTARKQQIWLPGWIREPQPRGCSANVARFAAHVRTDFNL